MNLLACCSRALFQIQIVAFCFMLIISNINDASAKAGVDEVGMKCVRQAIKDRCYHKAFDRLCNMADHDCVYSQCLLGLMYEKGIGVEKDINKALDWYGKAAGRGFADAEFRLGEIYYLGKEVKREPLRAYRLLNSAALQGIANAQYYVGRMYLEGDGVPKELRKARRWLHLAADRGIDEAKRLISQSELAEESVSKAKKLGAKVQEHFQSAGRLYGQTLEQPNTVGKDTPILSTQSTKPLRDLQSDCRRLVIEKLSSKQNIQEVVC